ncbi:MAG: 50S ribosomal protein L4 [Clostridiales bacterium]|jgi:large subunit ribosomal protein L4|nr:50S ribosomal protein L4 [Clostridiales bacterium]
MAQTDVIDTNGGVVGRIELADSVFAVPVNKYAMHSAVVAYLANQRQGTKSAKTRAEVRGGGIKPRPQKGSGRSRQGSIRAPQWKGGGVVFAPKPRDFSIKINKKERRLALKSALSDKLASGGLIVLDSLKLDAVKTKVFAGIVGNIKAGDALFVIDASDRNVVLSARNIAGIETMDAAEINTYKILKYGKLVLTRESAARIEEVWA